MRPRVLLAYGQRYVCAVEVGPRGGHIIGKTKSGKPIYAPHEPEIEATLGPTRDKLLRDTLKQHEDFSAAEHMEAHDQLIALGNQHFQQRDEALKAGDVRRMRQHHELGSAYGALANKHYKKALRK